MDPRVIAVTLGALLCVAAPERAQARRGIKMEQGTYLGNEVLGSRPTPAAERWRFRLGAEGACGLSVQQGRLSAAACPPSAARLTIKPAPLVGLRLTGERHGPAGPVGSATFVLTAQRPLDASGEVHGYLLREQTAKEAEPRWLCGVDDAGQPIEAVPIAALWNGRGERVPSKTEFTLACGDGVLAKCIEWGYKPWGTATVRTGGPALPRTYGMAEVHQACSRMARADYNGDGNSYTYDHNRIFVWDEIPVNGRTRTLEAEAAARVATMVHEANWLPGGATCIDTLRLSNLSRASFSKPPCQREGVLAALAPAGILYSRSNPSLPPPP